MENMDGRPLEDIVAECVERLSQGYTLDDVLLAYPGMGAQLLPALEPALALLRAPLVEPSPAARNTAMQTMLRQVRDKAARPEPAGVFAWLGSLRGRPLAFQALAVTAAIILFSGLGIGASAATGTAPQPVRSFFRISSESQENVSLSGAIVSNDGASLVIRTASGDRTALLSMSTVVDRDGERIDAAELNSGEEIEVSGTQHDDGSVSARRVHARALPVPSATPAGQGAPPAADDRTPGGTPDGTPGHDDAEHSGDRGDDSRDGPQASPTREPDDGGHDGEDDHDATPPKESTPEDDGHEAEITLTPDHEDGDNSNTPEPSATKSPESDDSTSDHSDNTPDH